MSRKSSSAREPACYEVVVLEMLVDILLSPERRYINKFATTITSKVNPFHVCLTYSGLYYSWQARIPTTSSTASKSSLDY